MATPATDKRLGHTTRDMLLSIGVVVGLIAVIFVFTFSPADENVKVIDYQPALIEARNAALFPVAAPVGLAPEWQANAVRYRTSPTSQKIATWHLGFVNGDSYIAVDQTNSNDTQDFLKETTAEGKPQGRITTAGRQWTEYNSESRGHKSLVNEQDGVTTVVTGNVDYPQLSDFAAKLRTN